MKRRVLRREDWRLKPRKKMIPAMTAWQLFAMEMSRSVNNAVKAFSAFGEAIAKASVLPTLQISEVQRRLIDAAERERMRATQQIRDILEVEMQGTPSRYY